MSRIDGEINSVLKKINKFTAVLMGAVVFASASLPVAWSDAARAVTQKPKSVNQIKNMSYMTKEAGFELVVIDGQEIRRNAEEVGFKDALDGELKKRGFVFGDKQLEQQASSMGEADFARLIDLDSNRPDAKVR